MAYFDGTPRAEIEAMYYGLNPNKPDPAYKVLFTSGATLAHFAAQRADAAGLRIALERGARLGPDDLGRTPLHYLAEPTNSPTSDDVSDTVQLLLAASVSPQREDGNHQTCYLAAARAGHPDLVEALARNGVRLTATDRTGNTGLHLAAAGDDENHVRLAKAFLAADVDPALMNKDGETAHDIAVRCGHQAIAAALSGGPEH